MIKCEADEKIILDDILSSLNTQLEQGLFNNIPYEYMPNFSLSLEQFNLNYPSLSKKEFIENLESLQDKGFIFYIYLDHKKEFVITLKEHEQLLEDWKNGKYN